MLFNNAKCTALSCDYVNSATGLQLHQFKWLAGDHLIGELPPKWNFLVGYDHADERDDIALFHYTTGGPYFDAYRDTEHADVWREVWKRANYVEQDK